MEVPGSVFTIGNGGAVTILVSKCFSIHCFKQELVPIKTQMDKVCVKPQSCVVKVFPRDVSKDSQNAP